MKASDYLKKFLVKRPQNTVIVAILPRVEDNKYSFVNLTEGHICKCKFSTIKDAIADMDKQIELRKVIKYTEINI